MGKLAALLIAGSGTAAVSVGGFYLVKNSGTGEAGSGSNAQLSSRTFIDSLSSFKKENVGDDCFSSLFSTVENLSTLTDSSEFKKDNPKSADFFDAQSQDSNKNKSCLIINWQKQTKNDGGKDKWSGIFTWSWSFFNDKKGFATFNVAKTSAGNKLKLTGGTYLLNKEGNDNDAKWKVKYHKEIQDSDNKEISTSSNFDDLFPKNKDGYDKFKVNSKDYWDFIENGSKLSEICGEGDCKVDPKPTPISHKWLWKWVNQGTEKVGEWSNNLKWWENMYGKENFDLNEKIKDFSGKWEGSTAVQ